MGRDPPHGAAGAGLTEDDTHLTEHAAALDAAWRHLADRLDADEGQGSVRVEADRDGRAHIRVDRLGKLEEPPTLTALKELTSRLRNTCKSAGRRQGDDRSPQVA